MAKPEQDGDADAGKQKQLKVAFVEDLIGPIEVTGPDKGFPLFELRHDHQRNLSTSRVS